MPPWTVPIGFQKRLVGVDLEDGASVVDLDEAHPEELRNGRARQVAGDDRLEVVERSHARNATRRHALSRGGAVDGLDRVAVGSSTRAA